MCQVSVERLTTNYASKVKDTATSEEQHLTQNHMHTLQMQMEMSLAH